VGARPPNKIKAVKFAFNRSGFCKFCTLHGVAILFSLFDGNRKVARVFNVGIGVSVASGVGCYGENGWDSNPLPRPNRMEFERQTPPNWGTSIGAG